MPRTSKQSRSSAAGKGKKPVRGSQTLSNSNVAPAPNPAKTSKAQAPPPPSKASMPAGRGNKRRRDDVEVDKDEAGPSRQAGRPSKKANTSSQVVEDNLPAADQESGDEDADEDDFSAPVLKARTRKIPVHTMNSKWVNLTEAQRSDAQTIIQSTARQVLMGFRKNRERLDAQKVLDQVSEKLERRLGRFLAPQCKDFAFNFEKLHDENRRMEAILEPSVIQIGELEATIESEKLALERDQQQLETLKRNAHDEEVVRKKQARTMHPSLRKPAGDEGLAETDSPSVRVVEEKLTDTTNFFNVADDKRMLSLTKKLQNHFGSMQTNRAALGVIPEHLQITRAVVDDVVYGKTNRYDEMSGMCLAPILRQGQEV